MLWMWRSNSEICTTRRDPQFYTRCIIIPGLFLPLHLKGISPSRKLDPPTKRELDAGLSLKGHRAASNFQAPTTLFHSFLFCYCSKDRLLSFNAPFTLSTQSLCGLPLNITPLESESTVSITIRFSSILSTCSNHLNALCSARQRCFNLALGAICENVAEIL